MGILNVTPDSFSDGGVHFKAQLAIDAGLRMSDEGADLLDVGGESTRPGAEQVPLEEELRRVLPVIERLARAGIRISVDTMKAEVARQGLLAGASMINDVTALGSPEMPQVVSEARCDICLMHMQGDPRSMQKNPTYDDVLCDVRDHLLARADFAQECGIDRDKIWLDPGIGFGKTVEHNLRLLRDLDKLTCCEYPLMVGISRKSFIGKVLGGLPVEDRLDGTLAAQVVAQLKGARVIRAHDVVQARRAIDMVAAIQSA